MRSGCCLGVLVILLLVAAAVGGAGWLVWKAGVFEQLPEQQLASELRTHPSVLLVVDPDAPGMTPLWQAVLGRYGGMFAPVVLRSLPHQAVFALEPDRQRSVVQGELLLSTRSLSGLFENRLNDTETWRWTPGQTVTRAAFDTPGMWRVDSTYGLRPEVQLEASKRWIKPGAPVQPLAPRHAAQLLLDNRDGAAFLALSPILNPPPQPGDMETTFDAALYSEWFACVDQLEARFDAELTGNVRLWMEITCPGEAEARRLRFALEQRRDDTARWIGKWGGRLEGQWERDGTILRGDFLVADALRLLDAYMTWEPAF
ncbi:MAG: hypothetical protein GC168_15275 [Candidatus Hydrogenedens sp.]|nr:hypothetical protein [Candidatus Hydrogenedens sp.]